MFKIEATYKAEVIEDCRIFEHKLYRRSVCKYFWRRKSSKQNTKPTIETAIKFAVQLHQSNENGLEKKTINT